MDTSLIRPERYLRGFLRIIGFFYTVQAIVFIFIPDLIFDYISNLGWAIFGLPVANNTGYSYYAVFTISFYITLAFVSFLVQANIIRRIDMVPILIVAMLSSSVGFVIAFISNWYFINILNGIINGFIFLVLWYYYQKVYHGRIR